MRIGMFTDAYFPVISGVSVSVEALAKELRTLGHEVYVIAHDHEHAKPEEYVIRIPGHRLPMKGMREYRVGKVTRKLVLKMLSYQFDIVHCHTEFTMGRLGRRTARMSGAPVVLTYHTMYEDYVHFISKSLVIPLRFLAKWYIKWFAASTNAVIFPTIKVKKTFDGYGFKGQGSIIPTGIYLDKFKRPSEDTTLTLYRKDLNLKDEDFVLLFLGRVSREKSISSLISQVAKIPHNDIVLVIVGDGPDRPLFEKQVDELGIRNHVRFIGMVAPEDVARYYHLADLFVNFSVTETQGLTYIEALASGLPLLVKYDYNLEGVVQPGVNGFTFTNDDEFVQRVHELYHDREALNVLQSNAAHAIDHFSAQTYAGRVEAIYKTLYKG